MKNNFQNILKGKIVVIGIGNILRGDDAFGPLFIERIKDRVEDIVCIDAGSAPENYTGKIAKLKPDTLLIVDAVHLGLKPGEYEILNKEDLDKSGFSTHNLSPSVFIGYLEEKLKANIYILGIQPATTSFGEKISASIEKTLEELSNLVVESIKINRKEYAE